MDVRLLASAEIARHIQIKDFLMIILKGVLLEGRIFYFTSQGDDSISFWYIQLEVRELVQLATRSENAVANR